MPDRELAQRLAALAEQWVEDANRHKNDPRAALWRMERAVRLLELAEQAL